MTGCGKAREPESALVSPPPTTPPTRPAPAIETPNPWFWLEKYQGTLTRSEFESRLHPLFDPFHGLDPFLEVTDEGVTMFSSPTDHRIPQFHLHFAPDELHRMPPPRVYRLPEEIRALPKPPGKPLYGLRVAIDPGHIGGPWAQIENRSIRYDGSAPVQEGDLNLITAAILRKKLTDLGAEVYEVRTTTDPVTPYRPPDLLWDAWHILMRNPGFAKDWGNKEPTVQNLTASRRVRDTSEFVFYRGSEITERGNKIRQNFRPDITITLYINATPGSGRARLTDANQVIFFVHGSYTKVETADPDQQIRMFYKILDHASPIEIGLATSIAKSFIAKTGLRPVPYADSPTTRLVVPDFFYVVARNLAANREYDGPVVCTEPYFMNNRVVYKRLLAGDYEGEQMFGGKPYRSIFREYADAVTDGLIDFYGNNARN